MTNKNKKKKSASKGWEFFQSLGKTFMLPVALLAFMGLLLGIGSSFTSPTTIETFPFLDNDIIQVTLRFIGMVGGFAFTYLPLLFAMAIPLGLVRSEKGVAAFAGLIGYVMMHLSINFYLTEVNQLADPELMQQKGQGIFLGIQSIEMGVLGGIIAGIIVYLLHKRFHNIELPQAFAFFGGARFVPIITAIVMSIVGLIIPMIWPFFAMIINGIGALISNAGAFGPFLFGAGERLLLPFGLHHILVALIRFTEAGGVAVVDGTAVSGALNIFYAQLSAGETISGSATAFLSQGKMPTFMFGLPGVALAMYHTARPENRSKIKGLLLSGVIATFVTGITEPIEFLFLFIAPALYGIHVVLTGLGFMTMGLLNVKIGNTDGGILDFLIFGVMQGTETKWYLVLVAGAIWFAIYYFVFRYAILKFNLATPGREAKSMEEETGAGTEEADTGAKGAKAAKGSAHHQQAVAMLAGLGGADNITSLDNCITRLRLTVDDIEKVDDDLLKQNGALGVMKLDAHSIQVVIGTHVSHVRVEMDQLME